MSSSDEREIRLEIVVPGAPEQVWEAIATGPGISSWFVPAEVDTHQGGKATLHFGAAGDDVSVVEAWEPPHRFKAVSEVEQHGLQVAVEYLVEARDGGSCVVRFVQSGFAGGAEWDDEYDETTSGWRTFLHNLRLYLTFFRGQAASPISVVAATPGPQPQVWQALAAGLGLPAIGEGDRVATSGDVPRIAGVVDRLTDGHATLLLDEPAPGFAVVAAGGGAETAYINMTAYLFGPDASAVAEREQPRWQAWVDRRFPAPAEGSN